MTLIEVIEAEHKNHPEFKEYADFQHWALRLIGKCNELGMKGEEIEKNVKLFQLEENTIVITTDGKEFRNKGRYLDNYTSIKIS